jgi:nucleoside-diphosphate-sugar epimerase
MHKKFNNLFALILQLRLVVSILLNRELLSTWYPGFLNTANAKNKTYNITKSHSTTLLEAATLAIKIAGRGTVEVRNKDADFPSRGALNIAAARGDFGFDPQVDVEEGFRRYHAWFKSSSYWKTRI